MSGSRQAGFGSRKDPCPLFLRLPTADPRLPI
jgi:hypothetical protein